MKRLDATHIGFPCNFSGRGGRKMGPIPRQCGVGSRKCRLNEEDVRILDERHDGGTICRRVGDIGNIGDLLAGSDGEQITQAVKPLETTIRSR